MLVLVVVVTRGATGGFLVPLFLPVVGFFFRVALPPPTTAAPPPATSTAVAGTVQKYQQVGNTILSFRAIYD